MGREEEENRWDSGFILEVEPTKFTNGLDKGDGGNRKTKETEWLSMYSVGRKEIQNYKGVLEILLTVSFYSLSSFIPKHLCESLCAKN